MTVEENVDNCIEAVMALIRELELIRDKKNTLEIQEAKLITDLLIPWICYSVYMLYKMQHDILRISRNIDPVFKNNKK